MISLVQIVPLLRRQVIPLPIEAFKGHLFLLVKLRRPGKSPINISIVSSAETGHDMAVVRLTGRQTGMNEPRPFADGADRRSRVIFYFSVGRFACLFAG